MARPIQVIGALVFIAAAPPPWRRLSSRELAVRCAEFIAAHPPIKRPRFS